jgi:hypothetical protein
MATDRCPTGKIRGPALAVLALSLLLAGCANGVLFNNGLYSHVVKPLTFNRQPTEMLNDMEARKGDIKQVQYQVSIRIGTNGIGEVAKKHGIETVYYADIETRSYLFGIWQQEILHIYGR